MKILKILAIAASVFILCAGCRNTTSADAPADVVAQEQSAANESPQERQNASESAAVPATAPKTTTKTQQQPVQPDAKKKTLRFSCAFWRMPENPPELFLRDGNRSARIVLFEQSFPNIFSVQTTPSVTIYMRGENSALLPFCTFETNGMEECAAIIFPKYDPANPNTQKYIRAFDVSEKAFPHGTYRICNFTGRPLKLKITPEKAGQAAVFTVKSGETALSPKVASGQERFDFEAYLVPEETDELDQPKLVWKTIGFLKSDERLCVILAEDEKRTQETGKLKLQTRSVPIPSFAPENKK